MIHIVASAWLILTATFLAVPLRITKEPWVEGWDRAVDPDGDCEFEPHREKLAITVPLKAHDLVYKLGRMNSPRLLRDVKGDFTTEVWVRGTFEPASQPTIPDRTPFLGAGLLIMADEKTYIRFERASYFRDDKTTHYTNCGVHDAGDWRKPDNRSYVPLLDKPACLQIERRGDQVRLRVMQGKDWTELPPINIALPDRVKVGVSATSTSAVVFRPEFEHFSLSVPPK